MNLYKAFAKVASLTMVSRITGFIRDVLHTFFIGAGPISDAFIIAFKFTNFFRRLFGEGAFSASFVPIFSSILASRGKIEALQFAQQSLSLLLGILIVIVGLAEAFMPSLMRLIAPGFLDEPQQFSMVIDFARITFPYLLFISLVSLYSGVLNSFHHFSTAAAAPILLNLCMIFSLIFFKNQGVLSGITLSWAVTIAGLLQLLWLLIAVYRKGYGFSLTWPTLSPDTKDLLKKMGPVALSGSIFQINLMVDTVLASFLPEGSVSYLYFADRLSELPLGVIGVTIGTALLPLLSKHVEMKEQEKVIHCQNRSIETAMLLALPAAIALFLISEPIIHVLFQRGAFSHQDVIGTSAALEVYAIGIPAFVLSKVFTTTFFAHKDTKTPLKIGLLIILVNFLMNLVLMKFLKHVGLALSTSISSWLQVFICFWVLRKRNWFFFDASFKKRMPRYILASLFMGGFLIVALPYCFSLLNATLGPKILALMILVLGGLLIYGFSTLLLIGLRPKKLKSLLKN